jgi:hypothetical protein
MRVIIGAVVAYLLLNVVFPLLLPAIWERFMSAAPEAAVRWTIFVGGLVIVAYLAWQDAIYTRLVNPQTHLLSSTALVAALLAAVGVSGWVAAFAPIRGAQPGGSAAAANSPPVVVPESQKSTESQKPLKQPTLFSLFVNDLHPGVGMAWNAFTDFDLPELRGTKVRVFYKVLDDFSSNAYFTAFYVPEIPVNGKADSDKAIRVITHIANNNDRFVADVRAQRVADWRGAGNSTTQTTRDLVPSRQVYVYYPGSLSLQQLAVLEQAFEAKSLRVQVRSIEYAMAAWQSIRMGDAKAPPEYEVRDGMPVLVSGQPPQK